MGPCEFLSRPRPDNDNTIDNLALFSMKSDKTSILLLRIDLYYQVQSLYGLL